MLRLSNLTTRHGLILTHDLVATAAAVVVAFYIRFEGAGLEERWPLPTYTQMTPVPFDAVRKQLSSKDWYDKVIAIRFFERKGSGEDVKQLEALKSDSAAVNCAVSKLTNTGSSSMTTRGIK